MSREVNSEKDSTGYYYRSLLPGVYNFITENMVDVPMKDTPVHHQPQRLNTATFGKCTLFEKKPVAVESHDETVVKGLRNYEIDVSSSSDIGGAYSRLSPVLKSMIHASQFIGRIFFENEKERYCATCALIDPRIVVTSRMAYPYHRLKHFGKIYAIFSIYGNPFTSHRYQLTFTGSLSDDTSYITKDLLYFETDEPVNLNVGEFLSIEDSFKAPDEQKLFLIGYPAFMDEECSSCITTTDLEQLKQMKQVMTHHGTKVLIRCDTVNSVLTKGAYYVLDHPGLNQMTGTCGFGVFKLPDSPFQSVKWMGLVHLDNRIIAMNHLSQILTPNLRNILHELKMSDFLRLETSKRDIRSHVHGQDRFDLSYPKRQLYMFYQKIVDPIYDRSKSNDAEYWRKQRGFLIQRMTEQDMRYALQYMHEALNKMDDMPRVVEDILEWPVESLSPYTFQTYRYAFESVNLSSRTTEFPLQFSTILLSNSSPDHSTIYTTRIAPYTQSWINTKDNQKYIQLIGFVRQGWKICSSIPSTELAKVALTVGFSTGGDCSLDRASIPSPTALSLQQKLERTNSHFMHKGVRADIKVDRGKDVDPTPSLVINYKARGPHDLKNLGVGINQLEFENYYDSDFNEVTWILDRKYSTRKRHTTKEDEIRLVPFNSAQPLSLNEFQSIEMKEMDEPFGDYVHLGVWKWDGRDLSFLINVKHGFRHLIKKSSGQYITSISESELGSVLRFPRDFKEL